jgi:hypothetical protein
MDRGFSDSRHRLRDGHICYRDFPSHPDLCQLGKGCGGRGRGKLCGQGKGRDGRHWLCPHLPMDAQARASERPFRDALTSQEKIEQRVLTSYQSSPFKKPAEWRLLVANSPPSSPRESFVIAPPPVLRQLVNSLAGESCLRESTRSCSLRSRHSLESRHPALTNYGLMTFKRPNIDISPWFGIVTVTGCIPALSTAPRATFASVGGVRLTSVQLLRFVLY